MGREANEYQPVENGRETPLAASREETKDTASGKFAHLTVEASSDVFAVFIAS
jgi:hypothetical protein